jgi:hypothetical protein
MIKIMETVLEDTHFSTVDVIFVKLLSDCICGMCVFKMNVSSAVTFAAVLLRFLETILFNQFH